MTRKRRTSARAGLASGTGTAYDAGTISASGEQAARFLADRLEKAGLVDRLITDAGRIGQGPGSRGGRPREVTLPMIRQAMAELVNRNPPKAPTQEAVQDLRGWDRKTIRARASEFPGGWVALRRDVQAAGE